MLTIDGKAVTDKDRCERCMYFKPKMIEYDSGRFGITCEHEGLCNNLERKRKE